MRSAAVAATATTLLALAAFAEEALEGPRTFKASALLKPAELKGPHHRVDEKVPTEGFFHEFTVRSDFGDLSAEGLSLLRTRVAEVEAVAKLSEVSKTEVFLAGAGRSLESVGKGVVNVAKDPGAIAKGIGGGLKRFGSNLGRKAKRASDDIADSSAKDEGKEKSGGTTESSGDKAAGAGEAVANAAFGVNKSARIWAQKLQVDPYTTNPVLAKALLEVGKLDAAAGIATKVVVPVPGVMSMTSSVGNLVWGQDPEALRKMNERRLAELGVSAEVAKAFFRNKSFSLTDQTRFIGALHAVKAKGLDDYVDAARESKIERKALFFVESAEMLERLNADTPVRQVLADSRAMVAKTSDEKAVALLPLDSLRWTAPVQKASVELAGRSTTELAATSLEMRLTGQASDRAKKELRTVGWAVRERVAVAPAGE